MEQILEIKDKIEKQSKIKIQLAEIVSEQRLNIKTSENWEIYFNPQEATELQIADFVSILKEEIPAERRAEIEYIDLRFDKKYYKYH